MTNSLRRHLTKIDSFPGRLAERRRLGCSAEAITTYAHQMLVNKRTNLRLQLAINDEEIPGLLTPDEFDAYERLNAAAWARRTRREIIARRAADAAAKDAPPMAAAAARKDACRKADAELRQRLLRKGAVSIGVVARRLGMPVGQVRKLHNSGQLPSAGFLPIQHSFGRPVHLWLPETIIRYLNRPSP